jgi:hypothetical protein
VVLHRLLLLLLLLQLLLLWRAPALAALHAHACALLCPAPFLHAPAELPQLHSRMHMQSVHTISKEQ